MSLASWLVGGMIPGVNREPLKKIAADPEVLWRLLYRRRNEGIKAGMEITRIAAERKGFRVPAREHTLLVLTTSGFLTTRLRWVYFRSSLGRTFLELWLQRSPLWLFTTTARSGLRTAPESRSRGAFPHLFRSFTTWLSVVRTSFLVVSACGQKIEAAARTASYPSRRSLTGCPLSVYWAMVAVRREGRSLTTSSSESLTLRYRGPDRV